MDADGQQCRGGYHGTLRKSCYGVLEENPTHGHLLLSYEVLTRIPCRQLLLKSRPNVVLIRENSESSKAVSTFDFKDLNAYLLVVVGLSKPEKDQIEASNNIVAKAQKAEPITLREIQPLCRKEALVMLSATSNLSQAMEVLGSGVHRLVVVDETGEAVGIMSQLRMVEFFWNEGVNFASIDELYPHNLKELDIGTKETISVKYESLSWTKHWITHH